MGDDYEVMNGVITKYISVAGLGVVAKRVGPAASATTFWMHTDQQGTIQAITDGTGAEVLRRAFRPYGDRISVTGTHVETRGWIDQRTDETGLTYLHARYYDRVLGLFISPDPLRPAQPGVGTNPFAYGADNPVNASDRSGLYWCPYPNWCEDIDVTPGGGGNALPSDRFGPYQNGNNNVTWWLWRTGRRDPPPGQSQPGPGSGQPIPAVTCPGDPACPKSEPPDNCRHCRSHEPWGGNGAAAEVAGLFSEFVSFVTVRCPTSWSRSIC